MSNLAPITRKVTLCLLIALITIPAIANESKLDPKKGESEYSVNGVKEVRIFDVGEHNVTNPDLPTRIEGKVRNISDKPIAMVTVHVAFYDSDGTRIAIVDDSIPTLDPNEVARFQVDEPEGARSFRISGVIISTGQ